MSFQIETERLIIRDVEKQDFPILIAQFAEPEAKDSILSHQSNEEYNKNSLENAMAWARVVPRLFYKLAVERKSDGELIGCCILSDAAPESFETNIGWHYGYRFRGNGYATEAAGAMLDFGFEFVKVNEIYADCFADNQASIKIMKKIGMTSQRNFSLFNTIRGWSYGESKPVVRYTISRNQQIKPTKT